MNQPTAIGPAGEPAAGEKRKTRATSEGVDAQSANEFDMRHRLAGMEAKAFAQPSAEKAKQGASSQAGDDPNAADPNARTDMIEERRHPGSHGGGGDAGRRKP